MTAPETHGPQGIGYASCPSRHGGLSERHAADLIIAEAAARPGEVTLITARATHQPRRRARA